MGHIPEKDWKYLRSIHDEMLEKLCRRINEGAAEIVADASLSQHERYLRLYRYLHEHDKIVAHCFNDWRRSNIALHLLWLRREQLLTDEQLAQLSPETRASL